MKDGMKGNPSTQEIMHNVLNFQSKHFFNNIVRTLYNRRTLQENERSAAYITVIDSGRV